jgi:hypothetical protein
VAQVHRGLAWIGGDFDEQMAESKVFAGESMLFRPEDQGDASATPGLVVHDLSQIGKRNDLLFGLAIGEGSSAHDQRAVGDGFGEARGLHRSFEQLRRTHGRACLAPMRSVGCNDGQARKAKVGHGARRRANVERVARRDENDLDAVALGFWRQEMIVERREELVDAGFIGLAASWSVRQSGWLLQVSMIHWPGAIIGERMRMNRRDSLEAARETILYMLPVYLSFYQALLVAGFGRAIVLLLLTVLLMFLVANRAEIFRTFAAALKALPSSWVAPAPRYRLRDLSLASLHLSAAPSLSPLFQRPPPIFS